LIFTADGSIAPQRRNVKRGSPCVVTLGDVTKITLLWVFKLLSDWEVEFV